MQALQGKKGSAAPTLCGPPGAAGGGPKLPLPDRHVPSILPIDTADIRHDSPILQKQTLKPEELNPHALLPPAAPLLSPRHSALRAPAAPGSTGLQRRIPAPQANRRPTYLSRAERHGSRCPRPRGSRGAGRGSRPGAPGCRAGGPPESAGERRAGSAGWRSGEAGASAGTIPGREGRTEPLERFRGAGGAFQGQGRRRPSAGLGQLQRAAFGRRIRTLAELGLWLGQETAGRGGAAGGRAGVSSARRSRGRGQ